MIEATSPPNLSGTTPLLQPTPSSPPGNSSISSPQTSITGPPSTHRCSPGRAVSNKPASPPASSPICPAPWSPVCAHATHGSTSSPTTPGPTPSISPSPNPPSTTTPPKASAPRRKTSSSSTTEPRTSKPRSPSACRPSCTQLITPSKKRCALATSTTCYNYRGIRLPKTGSYSTSVTSLAISFSKTVSQPMDSEGQAVTAQRPQPTTHEDEDSAFSPTYRCRSVRLRSLN